MMEKDILEIQKNNEMVPVKWKWEVWERRTKIERYLFIFCILLIIIFIVIVVCLLIIHHKNSNIKIPKKELICLTPICREEAGRILQNMDITVNPCDDFYDFTCGSYLKYRNKYSDMINAETELTGHISFLQKEALEKSEEEVPDYAKKVKMFYKSCLKETISVKEILEDFLNTTKITDWPFFKYPRYKYSNINIEEIIAKAAIYEDTGLLFSIIPILKNGSLQYIRIFSGNGAINDHGYLNDTDEYFIQLKEKYTTLFRYVFMNIGMDATEVEEIKHEIIEYETSLAEIRQKTKENNFTMITVRNMETFCNQIKWTYLFKFMFEYMDHSKNYSEDNQLKVDMELMTEICKLVKKTDNRIIYNSIIWNIFINYLYQIDFVFRQLATDKQYGIIFGNKYIYSTFHEKQKWRKCIENLKWPFMIGLEYYLLEYIHAEEKIEEIKNYVKLILKTTEEVFAKEKWLDDFSRLILKLKINNIKFYIGYANSSYILPMLEDIFSKINVTENYVQNILEADKYIYTDKFFEETLFQLIHNKERFNVFLANAFYRERNNFKGKITIPLGIMHPPFYSYNAPKYLNYGGIGCIIAHEISHGFDSLAKLQKKINDDDEQEIEWPVEFLEEFTEKRTCFLRQYSKLNLEGNISLNGKLTIKEDFSDNSAIVLSFRAYEKYLQQHGEEPKLPGLDYNNKQMFFIAFAQKNCERMESARASYEGYNHNPYRYRTLVPLMNFLEFSKAFNCPPSSNMNPEEKCRLWS